MCVNFLYEKYGRKYKRKRDKVNWPSVEQLSPHLPETEIRRRRDLEKVTKKKIFDKSDRKKIFEKVTKKKIKRSNKTFLLLSLNCPALHLETKYIEN